MSRPHPQRPDLTLQLHELGPLVRRQRAVASPPGVALCLVHPAAQRRLRQVEPTRDHRGGLPALLHHLDRLRLDKARCSTSASTYRKLCGGTREHPAAFNVTGSPKTTTSPTRMATPDG